MKHSLLLKKKKEEEERKKERTSFAAIWMNQEIIMLSEVNETQKENTIYHYMWNLKYDMNECIYKTEKSSQSLKKKLMITKG